MALRGASPRRSARGQILKRERKILKRERRVDPAAFQGNLRTGNWCQHLAWKDLLLDPWTRSCGAGSRCSTDGVLQSFWCSRLCLPVRLSISLARIVAYGAAGSRRRCCWGANCTHCFFRISLPSLVNKAFPPTATAAHPSDHSNGMVGRRHGEAEGWVLSADATDLLAETAGSVSRSTTSVTPTPPPALWSFNCNISHVCRWQMQRFSVAADKLDKLALLPSSHSARQAPIHIPADGSRVRGRGGGVDRQRSALLRAHCGASVCGGAPAASREKFRGAVKTHVTVTVIDTRPLKTSTCV